MNLLLDSCLSQQVKVALVNAGYDVVWAGDWAADPGDDVILAQAFQDKRVLITLDKDFGELAILKKQAHAGIIRLVNLSVKQHAAICIQILQQYEKDITAGAILTVETDRVRIRPAEA